VKAGFEGGGYRRAFKASSFDILEKAEIPFYSVGLNWVLG